MNRFYVSDYKTRNAFCNDGTPATFYVRKATNSTKWLIFFKGGGGCYDKESCDERYSNNNILMSSKHYPETLSVPGTVCDDDCTKNPAYCEYNQVFVKYCTSDWWSGNNTEGNPYFFSGKNVVRGVIEDLIFSHGMDNATEVTLSGSSAGGVGVWSNSDFVGSLISSSILSHEVKYSVLSDSAWFLDGQGFNLYPCTTYEFCNIQTRFEMGMKMWNFVPHSKCGAYYRSTTGEIWRCLIGHNIYPFVEARKFAVFNLFDLWQSYEDFGVYYHAIPDLPDKQQQWMTERGMFIYDTIEQNQMKQNGGVLALGCYDHVIIYRGNIYPREKTIDGQYINQIIKEFEQGGSPYVIVHQSQIVTDIVQMV